ncbi:MAG: protein kinase [Rubrivivax sp.]
MKPNPPLTPGDLAQLSAWLDEAWALEPAALAAWLEGPAVPAGPLRDRLRSLLDAGRRPPDLPTLTLLDLRAAATHAGPYRLLRELGHGGMASVWLAQDERRPQAPPVAVKLPHLQRRRPDFVRRLERERRALAALDHPGITRLLDAGLDAAGQPYLVLEWVDGEPVDAWCRRREADLRTRLGLWLQAADAVAWAHRCQVLHRDLKPSNVLVTAQGRVRLLDFGIAKLLDDGEGAATELTQEAGRPMTPEYASPEQLRGDPLGIASDVYSMGVMLYELLCGTRPHRREGRTPAAFEAEVVGTPPPRPSEVAADPAWRDQLAGNLDAVLLKALRKPAHERYRSVQAMADDVQRHLDRRPVVAAGEAALPAAATPGRRRLPSRDVVLIGRQVERARVEDLLRSERLVTLVGVGGVGKTELAHAVSVSVADGYADGATWVDLAVLPGPEALVAAVAAAAGVGLPHGAGVDQLLAALARRHELLVLDNCEHLLAAVADFAAALLERAPALRVLATSREPLRLQAEQVLRLDPLPVPPTTGELARLRDSAAFQLLEQRVARNALDFRFEDTDAGAGAELCRALDGLPLALEMAAAWVPKVGFEGVLAMLRERPQMLDSEVRGRPPRQRSLAELLDWSCSLLGAPERQVLYRLSAFSGAFDLAAAESVAEGDGIDRWQARALVVSLVDKSLVSSGGAPPLPLRLLETTRLHAARRAAEAGAAEAAGRRHTQVMAAKAQDFVECMVSAFQYDQSADAFEPWYGEFDSAFLRACAAGDADQAAPLLQALRNLDGLRGVLTPTTARVEAAMRLLDRAGERARARILTTNASCGWLRDGTLTRTEAARQAVAARLALGEGDEVLQYTYSLLAVNAALEGHAEEARAALREADRRRDPEREPPHRLLPLVYGAHVERYVGDPSRSVAMMARALELLQAGGQRRFGGYLQTNLIDAAAAAGDFALVIERAPGFIA